MGARDTQHSRPGSGNSQLTMLALEKSTFSGADWFMNIQSGSGGALLLGELSSSKEAHKRMIFGEKNLNEHTSKQSNQRKQANTTSNPRDTRSLGFHCKRCVRFCLNGENAASTRHSGLCWCFFLVGEHRFGWFGVLLLDVVMLDLL